MGSRFSSYSLEEVMQNPTIYTLGYIDVNGTVIFEGTSFVHVFKPKTQDVISFDLIRDVDPKKKSSFMKYAANANLVKLPTVQRITGNRNELVVKKLIIPMKYKMLILEDGTKWIFQTDQDREKFLKNGGKVKELITPTFIGEKLPANTEYLDTTGTTITAEKTETSEKTETTKTAEPPKTVETPKTEAGLNINMILIILFIILVLVIVWINWPCAQKESRKDL
jgi:hypothetical protein